MLVFERGLQSEQMRWLNAHPTNIQVRSISHFPYHCQGLWEAKQQALAECVGTARVICLIDADIVLLSRIDDVFSRAEEGKIVAGCDGTDLPFGDEYAVYSPSLPGRICRYLNSGFLCLDVNRHWDMVGLWAFSSSYGAYSPNRGYPLAFPGHGDQGILNAILLLLRKEDECHVLPHGVWHDFRNPASFKIVERHEDGTLIVNNCNLKQRQRILHCIGYKWWWDAPETYHGALGDKLRCFRHFFQLKSDPVS